MADFLKPLIDLLRDNDGINDKAKLSTIVSDAFSLTRDRSVFYCHEFAIRFSAAGGESFSNTVLSLSILQKYDAKPFLVCVVTPSKNHLFLANTTFLKKISHSSQQLRQNNIRGSFNGSDILRQFDGIPNEANAGNLEKLYNIHQGLDFETNLIRLVDATNGISPTGKKFLVSSAHKRLILEAPVRALAFIQSDDATTLKNDLDAKVKKFKNEILLAALIENVNVRGRIIEYLIAGEDEQLRTDLIHALQGGSRGLPQFKTENALGDYSRAFDHFLTETDVKTKIMILDSNPKAYNLDKILEFLSKERSIFMFYFVGVDPTEIANTVLISMFQTDLLKATILLKHWAGRNSRGVTQLEGRTVGNLIKNPSQDIDIRGATEFLESVIGL